MNDESSRLRTLDSVDSLIDRVLDSYTPREDRPGLAERVLSSQASVAAVNHFWSRTYRPIWELAAAAALLAVAVIPLWVKSSRPALVVVQQAAPAGAEVSPREVVSVTASNPTRGVSALFSTDITGESAVRHSAFRSEFSLEPAAELARMPDTDESLGFAPIVIKPIALAPIQIAAAN